MRKLKLFSLFLCLFIGIGQMWGAEETISFASSSTTGTAGQASFVITWSGNTSCTLVQAKGSGNAVGNYTTAPRWYQNNTITITPKSGITISKIVFTGSGSSYNGQTMSFSTGNGAVSGNVTTWTGSISGSTSLEVTPGKQFRTGSVVVTYSTGGSSNPTVSLNPDDKLNFATVGVGDEAPEAQSFTITGSNMTAALSIADLTNFDYSVTSGSLSPSKGSISATVTVTPKSGFTASAGDKSEMLKISGGDLDAEIELALNAEVKAKHTVTWNNNGTTSTTQVIDSEKPVFPETPTSCDATSTTFIGWATAAWDGKIANLNEKTVYTSAAEMPAVTGPVGYFAVFAKATAGAEEEHEGPSFSRTGSNDTYTTGYTFSAQAEGKTEYYQDGSGDLRYIQVLNATTPIFSETPNRVTVTAKIGGGTDGKGLTDPVQAQLLDNTGAPITGAVVAITSSITTATGDTYADIEIPITGVTSAYGVRISHQKQSGYNVRYYSFSLKYYTGGATYSDYMTTCCTKHAIALANSGTVTGEGTFSADLSEACEGTTVTITAVPGSAYNFSTITVYETADPTNIMDAGDIVVDGNEAAFEMPGYAVTVNAVFTAKLCTKLDRPSVTVSGKAYPYDAVQLSWTAIEDAEDYEVYIYNNDDTDVENDLAGGVSYTIGTRLEPSTTYKYKVTAVSSDPLYCASDDATGTFTTDALPTAHLTLIALGDEHEDTGDYSILTPFNLPSTAASCAKAFYGWTATENYTSETVAPEYKAGDEFMFNDETPVTLYAVYADVTPGATTYTLTPAASMSEGTYVIAAYDENYKALTGAVSSGKLVNETTGSAIDGEGKLESLPTDACEFTFTAVTGGYSIQKPNDDYLGYTGTSDNNKLAFGNYSSLIWSVNANAKDGSPANGVSLTTSKYKVSANANAGSDTWVRGYPSSGSIYKPIYLFKKATAASTATNYSTTCAAAPAAEANATDVAALVNVAAAGASGTITMTYEHVNASGVAISLWNNAACTEAFNGGWLTASLDEDKNITYTIEENTSYNDARSAYIRLIAPETSGAASPVDVRIPVSQVKKAAVFASLEELAAADVNANTEVTVSFSDVVIKEIYMYKSDRRGLVFNIQKDGEDVKIYFNADVPAAWVAGGKVSGTLTNCPWKIYSDAWQLAPASGWAWDNLTYTAPPAIESIEIRGNATQKTYIDGQVFNHTGLTVWAIYSDTHEEEVTALATWTYNPAKLSKDDTEVTVTAIYNEKSDDETVTGLTVNPIPNKTIAQFIEAEGTRCYLEGTVGTIENTKYGNFNLTDESGTIYVYGCLNQAGVAQKFEELGVQNGDKIKVIAEQYLNHATAGDEAVNVVFVSKVSAATIAIEDINMTVDDELLLSDIVATITPDAAQSATINYEVTEGTAVTISEGKIIASTEGEATITASIAAGEGYLAGSTTFIVTVSPAIVRTGIYAKVTSNEELKDGEYLIVYEDGSLAFNGGLEALDASSNNFAVTIESNKILATAEIDAKSFTIDVVAGTIKSASGKFIGKTADSNGMDEGTTAYTNTLSIDNEGNAVIVGSAGAYMRYNATSGQERFRYFKSASYTGQKAIQLYRKMDYTRAVSGNYGTICLPKAGVMTNGALYEISYYDADQKKIFFDEVEGGVMVAGAPYIFKPNEGVTTLRVVYTDAENVAEAGHNNGLIGHYNLNHPEEGAVDARQYLTNGDYFLRNNEYWLVDQENRVYVDNYRAYIKLNQINPSEQSLAPGRRRVAMNVNGEQVATGVENGELINGENGVQKVLIDGQLFILRGEKMYDAKGQLVK